MRAAARRFTWGPVRRPVSLEAARRRRRAWAELAHLAAVLVASAGALWAAGMLCLLYVSR